MNTSTKVGGAGESVLGTGTSGKLAVWNAAGSIAAATVAESSGALSAITTLAMTGALSGLTTLSMSGALSGGTTAAFSGAITGASLDAASAALLTIAGTTATGVTIGRSGQNTTLSGTLLPLATSSATGFMSATDKLITSYLNSGIEVLSATGAISVSKIFTAIESSGAGVAYTLADGTFTGQEKTFRATGNLVGTAVVTPAHSADFTTATLAPGDYVKVVWTGSTWRLVDATSTVWANVIFT